MLHRLNFLQMIEGVRAAEHQRWNKAVHFVVTQGAELFFRGLKQVAEIVVFHLCR
ncbi:hypothetical protein D3C81_2205360 [compost metagenome]